MRRTILLASCLSIALLAGAGADHCATWEDADAEVDTGATPAGRYYVENNMAQPCCWDWWIYEESNGIDGLQRQDEVWDATCHGMVPGDTVIL